MQNDELAWSVLSNFCSYKVKFRQVPLQKFCRHPMNATGVCSKQSCPLANSKYATVIEKKGKIFLCMKTPERAHLPAKWWQQVQLSKNYMEALQQINSNLQYWPKHMIHKCKARLTRIFQYLMRMRHLEKAVLPKLETFKKKEERQLVKREARAEAAANLEQTIEAELLERLRKGTYDHVLNYPMKQFENVVNQEEELEDQHQKTMEDEKDDLEDRRQQQQQIKDTDEDGENVEFVEDFDEDLEDIEDLEDFMNDDGGALVEGELEEEAERQLQADLEGQVEEEEQDDKKKKKRKHRSIEYEHEETSRKRQLRRELA